VKDNRRILNSSTVQGLMQCPPIKYVRY